MLANKFQNLQSGGSCLLFSMSKSKRVCVSVLQASDGYHVLIHAWNGRLQEGHSVGCNQLTPA